MVDVAEFALNFINDYVLKRLNSDEKKDFRSRTRQLYSMAYFENLKSTIAFAYSKAKENAVKSLVENKEINIKEDSKKDYAYYLLGIIELLKKEGYQEVDGSIDSLMKEIKDKSIENKILNYMKWLKYFAEAKIEGG
jgi:CRISPR type III-B/RAMP module-associated protein Cmr5